MIDPAQLEPCPPQWALLEGVPEPKADDTFESYVLSLGLDPYALVDGLTEQTACLVEVRFDSVLKDTFPEEWQRHFEVRLSAVRSGMTLDEVLHRQARLHQLQRV